MRLDAKVLEHEIHVRVGYFLLEELLVSLLDFLSAENTVSIDVQRAKQEIHDLALFLQQRVRR